MRRSTIMRKLEVRTAAELVDLAATHRILAELRGSVEGLRRYPRAKKQAAQVEAAFSAAELGRIALPTTTPDKWTIAERARASFDPARTASSASWRIRSTAMRRRPSGPASKVLSR